MIVPVSPDCKSTAPDPRTSWVSRLGKALRQFGRDASGATAIEYALISGLIFLAIVSSIRLYADQVAAMYNRLGEKIGQSS